MLLPILGRGKSPQSSEIRRRVMINAIGPFWDGNEVWLLTAGGATFAAFPHWYATLFSGFYLPLFLLLLALILRGVAFEFRGKHDNPRWRKTWDWAIFGGSLVPALLLGVAFANLARGVPIDAEMNYAGGFFNLLNPYALLGGLATVLTFALHGSIFLSLRTADPLRSEARVLAWRLWVPVVIALFALLGATYLETDILIHLGVNPGPIPVAGAAAALLAGYFVRKQRDGWAFAMTALAIGTSIITCFMILYPRVMISSLDPAFSLTIQNAASSPYTLKVMSVVALIFVPVVLLYQGWSYWVFRRRVEGKPESLTY
jgi:cytochrome d ubiquinol oxidase subunit II